MGTRNRTELKAYFVKNAIPTESNFADLVDSQLNQAEDGVFKMSGEALAVVSAGGDQKRVLRLFAGYPAANPDWQISLNPAQDAAHPATARPGFGVVDGVGKPRLFIDAPTGKVGIGTTDPADLLTVSQGDVRVEGGRYRRLKIISDQYYCGVELVARQQGEAGHPYIDFTHGDLDAPNFGIRVVSTANNTLAVQSGDQNAVVDVQGTVSINGKHAIRGNDGWLRLNQDGAFPSGVHTPGNLTSSALNVGGVSGWGNPGSGNATIAGKLNVGSYGPTTARVNAGSMEIGGPAPTPDAAQGGVLFLHDHGHIAHQLRYNGGTLYLEAAGSTTGYGTNPRPTLALGGDIAIEGKHAIRGNDPWLRLNQDKAFTAGVHTPGNFAPNSLNVGGHAGWGDPGAANAWIEGKLTVFGDVQIGATIAAPGRMHITGNELCYMLHKNGVIIGKEWGGNGNLSVQGSKNFHIDHPLDPNRYLVHSVIEGPEAAVIYRGEAALTDGECEVVLPQYFEALVRRGNRSVQLTPILTEGGADSALGAGEVANGRFVVRAIDGRNPKQRFYWEVKAVRADIDPIEVEPLKADFPAAPMMRKPE